MKKQFYTVRFDKNKSGSDLKYRSVRSVYDIITAVATATVAAALLLTFVFRTATVEGFSMNPTLNDEDRIIITGLANEYEYGDIVVIYRENDVPLIKRVIAVAGDTIDIDFENGIVTVNGVELQEDYIAEPTYRSFSDGPDFPLYVPRGFVFVMGDNRNDSLDSRSGEVGLVNTQHIVGKMIIDFNSEA